MMRDVLIFSDDFSPSTLDQIAEALDWELLHRYPARVTSHAGRIWSTPRDHRVRYIEVQRFNSRYLLSDEAAREAEAIYAEVRRHAETIEPSALFEIIESSQRVVERIEALHKSSALVTADHADPAYAALLTTLLDEDASPWTLQIAALQVAETLRWPSLRASVARSSQRRWRGRHVAERALDEF